MIKFLLAAALLPTAVFASWEALRVFYSLLLSWRASLPFMAGFFIYFPARSLPPRSNRAYVLAHELSHAAAGILCGYKVRSMNVGSGAGNVTLSGTNAFVALAPYCVPFYALLVLLAVFLVSLKIDITPYRQAAVGAIGFFTAFHLANTFETLYGAKQSDLRKAGGVLFSVCVILLANSLVVLAAAKLLYPGLVSVRAASSSAWTNTLVFWREAGQTALVLAGHLFG